MISALSTLFYFIAVLSDKDGDDEDESFEDVDMSEDAILTMIFSKIKRGDTHEVTKMMGLSKFFEFYAGLDESTKIKYPDISIENSLLIADMKLIGNTVFVRDVYANSTVDLTEIKDWEMVWDINNLEGLTRGLQFLNYPDLFDMINNRDDVECFMDYVGKFYHNIAVNYEIDEAKRRAEYLGRRN